MGMVLMWTCKKEVLRANSGQSKKRGRLLRARPKLRIISGTHSWVCFDMGSYTARGPATMVTHHATSDYVFPWGIVYGAHLVAQAGMPFLLGIISNQTVPSFLPWRLCQ